MKSVLVRLLLLTAFLLLLATPTVSVAGAKRGLILWANTVVPTLLPAMILAAFLVRIQATSYLTKLLHPILRPLFHFSEEGSFCFITGILCGYPMGVKTINDLLQEDSISPSEARRLLAVCSFPSPMFLIGYVLNDQLHAPEKRLLFLLSIYLPAIFLNLLAGLLIREPRETATKKPKAQRSSVSIRFEMLEQTVTDCSGIMIKIGVFMMLFSILTAWLQSLHSLPALLRLLISMLLEMTVGVSCAAQSALNPAWKLIACGFCTAFGGLCTFAQTCVVMRDQRLHARAYLLWKLLHACLTAFLLWGLCFCFLRGRFV